MAVEGYWDALDKLAAAYGARNRVDAMRGASLMNGIIAVPFAALALYAGLWPLATGYTIVSVLLFVAVGVARRRMRLREREIALLRILIVRIEQRRGGLWTH